MCRGRRDTVVGLALLLLRASAKGLFDEITPAKPRVRSELVLAPPPPPPPALAVAAPLRPIPPSPWPGRGAVVMERGRPAHAKACCLSALLFGALRFAAAAPADYHYETTSRGSGDDRRTSTRRVVTAVARETWAYGAWRRDGGVGALRARWRRACSVTPSARRALVKIRLRRSLAFDDAATADEYAAALADFARRHRRRDVHLSLEQDFSFKGWDEDERILGIRRPLGAPGALWSPAGFWAAAGLGLTVPYRLAFERKCAVASLDVAKRVRSAPHVAREADPVI
ncbi:putative N6-adenine methyltransferase [Aureococcus anophagefferens]|uniref:N6-adenine methyltransferase n=1 Tax=Aureococcus anophagefferens TaxID=44056 RepID=A0ABR1G2G6_AURAN